MWKVIARLKKYWVSVVIIFVMLAVQATCELALPTSISRIVDIGIQQGGIEHSAPVQIRETSFEALKLMMTESEAEAAAAAYTAEDGILYRNKKLKKEELAALDRIFTLPFALMSPAAESGIEPEKLLEAAAAGQVTREMLLEIREKALAESGLNEGLAAQMAAFSIRNEYEAMGMDLHKIQMNYLFVTGGKMLGLSVMIMAAAILVGLLASRLSAGIGRDMRQDVFHRVVSFSSAEIDRFSTASLITRSTNDVQQVQMAVVVTLRTVIYAPIMGIGGIIKVSSTRTGMGWLIAVAVISVLSVFGILFSMAMPRFKKTPVLIDNLNLVSREVLTGLPVIRAFNRQKHEEDRFDKANRDLMFNQLVANRLMNIGMPAIFMIMNIITVLIVWFGAKGMDAGRLQVGDMMAFINYTMQIIMGFMMITMVSVMLPRASVAANRIQEVLSTEPAVEEPASPRDSELEHVSGCVAFENVSFRFPGADEDSLHNISFTARPGQVTAVIGSTGCGKSTVLNLIPRFYDVTGGRITIDGVDIREISQHKLRSMMGYVPQKAVLFSGSIESNIKFSERSISDDEMKEAAAVAQAGEFITSKPEGYESHIAQGGSNVSGGQKQRLSIARAVAENPQIYLFDDSFSALDYKTDAALRQALNRKSGNATVFIVAQRISTILHADQIIVLDEGRIAGIGRHEELLESCETYREIARSQLSEKEFAGNGGRAE